MFVNTACSATLQGIDISKMTFMLAAMEQSDIAECADVDEAAMKDWPYAQAHHQPPFSRKDLFRYWVSKEWGQNQNHHWMKVTDSDTGEMAAVAWWQFESRDSDSHNTDDEDEQKETVGSSEPGNIDPKFPKIWIQTGRRWRTFRNEFIGEQAHAGKTGFSLLVSIVDKVSPFAFDHPSPVSTARCWRHASEMGLREGRRAQHDQRCLRL